MVFARVEGDAPHHTDGVTRPSGHRPHGQRCLPIPVTNITEKGDSMKKEQYMILRVPRPTVDDPFLGPLAGGTSVDAAPKVEVDEMERRDIPSLTRNPEVL